MPRSRVALLSWIVAISFIVATGLLYLDRLNLVVTPPQLPDGTNMVDRALGTLEYRQAIWPVFLWTDLLFAVGFAAAVVFAFAVSSASGIRGGLPAFVGLATVGGTIAALASVIPLGAVNAAVWLGYCDCGFKDTEIVSQQWAQIVALDISDWFNRFASVVLAIALVALVREMGGRISRLLRQWTHLTAIVLVVIPVLATTQKLDASVVDLLNTLAGVVLVPIWAVWLGRSIDAAAIPAT